MWKRERCSVSYYIKGGVELLPHKLALPEWLALSFSSQTQEMEGKEEVHPSWDHHLFPLAELPAGSMPASPLLLLFSAFSQEFLKFATIEAIQRTEIFEYCQMLGRPKSFIPSFQVTDPGCVWVGHRRCCV